jgi:hypothetical protein
MRTQFVGGYEQNMMTTARLGSAYHGVVANFTMNGTVPNPTHSNAHSCIN